MNYQIRKISRVLLLVIIAGLSIYIVYQLFIEQQFNLTLGISIASLCIAILARIPNFQKPNAETIELKDLIKLYLNKKKNDPNLVKGWTTGAEENSPIEWTTDGFDVSKHPYLQDYFMHRQGLVKLTLNNKPTDHVVIKKLEHAQWDIIIAGPHAGIFEVLILSDLSREINYETIRSYLEKAFRLKLIADRMPKIETSGDNLYLINHRKFHSCFLEFHWSCGSGGCSVTVRLRLKEGRNHGGN